jgi:serine/threonine protein kinase
LQLIERFNESEKAFKVHQVAEVDENNSQLAKRLIC